MGNFCPDAAPPLKSSVRVVELPDALPAKSKRRSPAAGTTAPWWIGSDVELVPPPANEPVFADLVHDAPRAAQPGRRWLIDVPLVLGSGLVALLAVGTLVFAAWHQRQPAAVASPPVAVAEALPFVEVPATVAAPVVETAPAAPEPPARIDPVLEQQLAEMERLKEVVAQFERRTQELEKEVVARTQQTALAQAKAVEPKGCYGTSVNFADGPAEAAETALKDKKLLMILTISGNFEEAKFT